VASQEHRGGPTLQRIPAQDEPAGAVTERPARRSPAQGGALLGNRAGIEVPGLSGDAIPDAIPSVHRQIVSSVCFVETQAVEVNNRFWPVSATRSSLTGNLTEQLRSAGTALPKGAMGDGRILPPCPSPTDVSTEVPQAPRLLGQAYPFRISISEKQRS
jgi:hypothetical protein